MTCSCTSPMQRMILRWAVYAMHQKQMQHPVLSLVPMVVYMLGSSAASPCIIDPKVRSAYRPAVLSNLQAAVSCMGWVYRALVDERAACGTCCCKWQFQLGMQHWFGKAETGLLPQKTTSSEVKRWAFLHSGLFPRSWRHSEVHSFPCDPLPSVSHKFASLAARLQRSCDGRCMRP